MNKELREREWKEFLECPGMIEAMNEVFEKTGFTLKVWTDDETGEVKKVKPVSK